MRDEIAKLLVVGALIAGSVLFATRNKNLTALVDKVRAGGATLTLPGPGPGAEWLKHAPEELAATLAPLEVTMVKMKDGETMRVLGEIMEVARKLNERIAA